MLNPFRTKDLVHSVGNLPAFVGLKSVGYRAVGSIVFGVDPLV